MKRIKQAMENMAMAVAFAEHGQMDEAMRLADVLAPLRESPGNKLLLVSPGRPLTPHTIEYVTGLSQRLECDVLALTVYRKRVDLRDEDGLKRIDTAFQDLHRQITHRGAICLPHVVIGRLCRSTQSLCRRLKGITFTVIQSDKEAAPPCRLPVPVFYIED